MLPKIFIASSGAAKQIARDVQELLCDDAECEVWINAFEPSHGTLQTLIRWLDISDFGIFIFAADDILTAKGELVTVTRDNVVFEAGLFIGRIGQDRNFIIRPKWNDKKKQADFKLPSDLLGITTLEFDDAVTDDFRV